MKRITPIRRRIGKRTIFNLMGPLANPAHVTRQLIGIARPDYVGTYAEALGALGTEAGLIVSGEEGLDEVSGAGPTVAIERRPIVDARPHRARGCRPAAPSDRRDPWRRPRL